MVQTSPAQLADSVIAAKALSSLGDLLYYEALLVKKYYSYSNECSDPNLKCVCDNAQQMHRRHYDTLLNYISSHNKQA